MPACSTACPYSLQRRYATSGQLTGITWPDGDAFGTPAAPITYDAAGRMKSVPGIVTSATYDALGRPAQRDQANGTVTMWSFDERGTLRTISTTGPGGSIQDLQYTPDALGRVETVTSPFPNESWNYGYDLLGRLQTATNLYDPAQSQAFDYDLAGNKTYDSRIGTISYPLAGSPRPHAPTAVAGQPMTYDPNGNLVSGRGRSYDWNVDNKPTAVNGVSFAYAGDGTRLKKTAPGGTTLYPLGDDYEIKAGVATKYLRLGGAPIAKRVGATSYWLHADRLGSVQAVTDAAGQDALRRTYRPYGQKIADSTSHWEPLGCIGERLDGETGLTYLHARYYDAELGMFVSADSADPAVGGLNRYAYGLSDPGNRTDPSGLMPVCEAVMDFKNATVTSWSGSGPPVTSGAGSQSYLVGMVCIQPPDIMALLAALDSDTRGDRPGGVSGSVGTGVVGFTGQHGVAPVGSSSQSPFDELGLQVGSPGVNAASMHVWHVGSDMPLSAVGCE